MIITDNKLFVCRILEETTRIVISRTYGKLLNTLGMLDYFYICVRRNISFIAIVNCTYDVTENVCIQVYCDPLLFFLTTRKQHTIIIWIQKRKEKMLSLCDQPTFRSLSLMMAHIRLTTSVFAICMREEEMKSLMQRFSIVLS